MTDHPFTSMDSASYHSDRSGRILVVDDNPAGRQLLVRRLTSLGYEVDSAESGQEAIDAVDRKGYDLVLLDIIMPDMSGMDVLQVLRATYSEIELPVIMVSALDESSNIAEALNHGANDYITKPIDVIIARARIRTHLRLKRAEEAVRRVDASTGLANKLLFTERCNQAFASAREFEGEFTVMVFGVDRFEQFMESLGLGSEEEFAMLVAERLRKVVRQADTIARLSRQDFAVLFQDGPQSPSVLRAVEEIQNGLREPFVVAGKEITSGVSAGVAFYAPNKHYERAEDVARDATIARNRARDLGGDRSVIFDGEMHAAASRLLQTEIDLRAALQKNELVVFYQPIVSAADGSVNGFEALIRWKHPHRGLVSPGDFIPLAEETGLIIPLGEYVLTEVCRRLRQWQGSPLERLFVAVNVSARQFMDAAPLRRIKDILREHKDVLPHLKMEVTESTAMHDLDYSRRTLNDFREMGVSLSIDDFGTGYSSLTMLKQLPIQTVKIDRSFVKDLRGRGDDRAIIQAILELSKTLGLNVIAEGVEDEWQVRFLGGIRCDEFQGFLFSPPLPFDEAEVYVQNGRRLPTSAAGDGGADGSGDLASA